MLKALGIDSSAPPSGMYKRGRWSSEGVISYLYSCVLSRQHSRADMIYRVILVATIVCSSQGLPYPVPPQTSRAIEPKQLVYLAERQQYGPELQYDLSLLAPQFQIPAYNFAGDRAQHFPRVQPQIFLYHGGAAPGRPFLYQPGAPPPGNFLVPQPGPGPNVILRDSPQRPVFVAGYPKPAHIPPIEKDAEEVPTNPSKIPPLVPKGGNKPEKIETFDEGADNSKKQATEAEVLAAADRNPFYNTRTDLRPGQRFFILNGQSLFSDFPYNNQLYPGVNQKFAQNPNVLLRSGQIEATVPTQKSNLPNNLVLLNQPGDFQDGLVYTGSLPIDLPQTKDIKLGTKEELKNPNDNFGFLQYQNEQDNDAIVIDLSNQDESGNAEKESEVVAAPEKGGEPTISQAQPGAIALAGPGGVAAAAPRGTAFVGKEGVAVSSPQATAVAGPTRDEISEQKDKKQNNKRKQ